MKTVKTMVLGAAFLFLAGLISNAQVITDLPGNNKALTEDHVKILASPQGASFKYKGILAQNVDGDTGQELICDFGTGKGIWMYDPAGTWAGGGTWRWLTGDDPNWMAAVYFAGDTNWEFVAYFPGFGLYWWDNLPSFPGTWTWLTSDAATNVVGTDDDNDGNDEIYVDFGTKGLWRYDKDTGVWTQKSNENPGSGFWADFWSVGIEETVWGFSTGTWSFWTGGSGQQWLTGDTIGDDSVSGYFQGTAYTQMAMDFGSSGMWVYDQPGATGTFRWITSDDPFDARVANFAGKGDVLLATFSAARGLYSWDYVASYPGTWTLLSPDAIDYDGGYCEPYDWNSLSETAPKDVEVACDFDAKGLWLYNSTSGPWWYLTSDNPERMCAAEMYSGNDEVLIVDFGAKGLWVHDLNNGWRWLTSDNVEQS